MMRLLSTIYLINLLKILQGERDCPGNKDHRPKFALDNLHRLPDARHTQLPDALLQRLQQQVTGLRYLSTQNNNTRINEMNDICQGNSQIGTYIVYHALRYGIALCRKRKYLRGGDAFGPAAGDLTNGLHRLRIFDRETDHGTHNGLC